MDSSYQLKYPIYIVSKGRWETPYTARIFQKENIDFRIAVEPQEVDLYAKNIDRKNILVLPFSNLGLGSYPARNEIWEDSIKRGLKKHFIFDDNIRKFDRLNLGKRTEATALEALKTCEIFSEKFCNLGITAFNYRYFVTKETKKPFTINTHAYSGMLIDNSLKFRWRLKYNEDVDLCLQVLDSGLCTILLNAFLIDKISTTVKLKGGNQDELYKNNDPMKKALKSRSLEQVWPQYVKVVYRFGRPHHFVDWRKHFKQPLLKKVLTNGST